MHARLSKSSEARNTTALTNFCLSMIISTGNVIQLNFSYLKINAKVPYVEPGGRLLSMSTYLQRHREGCLYLEEYATDFV